MFFKKLARMEITHGEVAMNLSHQTFSEKANFLNELGCYFDMARLTHDNKYEAEEIAKSLDGFGNDLIINLYEAISK